MSLVQEEMSDLQYQQKYLKYKKKYQIMKEQQGQGIVCNQWYYFFCFEDDFTGHNILQTEPAITADDYTSLKKFKTKVIYKAYELNSYGTMYSTLGLSYFQGLSGNKSNLYDHMFGKGPMYLTITNTANTKNGTDISNLEIDKEEFITRINNELISNLRYTSTIVTTIQNSPTLVIKPEESTEVIHKSPNTPSPAELDLENKVKEEKDKRYQELLKQKITLDTFFPKIRKIVTFYGDNLGKIYQVNYNNLSDRNVSSITEISKQEQAKLNIKDSIKKTLGSVLVWPKPK